MLLAVSASALPTDWVDPFIGTTNSGDVFPGATLPFGSVKCASARVSIARATFRLTNYRLSVFILLLLAVAECMGNENQGGFR